MSTNPVSSATRPVAATPAVSSKSSTKQPRTKTPAKESTQSAPAGGSSSRGKSVDVKA